MISIVSVSLSLLFHVKLSCGASVNTINYLLYIHIFGLLYNHNLIVNFSSNFPFYSKDTSTLITCTKVYTSIMIIFTHLN